MSSYEYQKRNETNEIFIPVADRLGDKVIEFKNVSKGFGDRLLIDDLSFSIPPGAIVGVIGPNGAGKSTLFKMITGKETPDSGEIDIGPTVKLSAVSQTRESLPNDKTVWEAVSDGLDILKVGKFEMPSRAYLGRFNFKGGDQQKIVGRSQAVNADVSIWPKRFLPAATFFFLTNRLTTWTLKPSVLWKKRCWNLPAAPWSFLMTAGS